MRDVLLSWISYSEASRPLNCVPSKPAVPHTRVSRVGSRTELVLAQRRTRVGPGQAGLEEAREPRGAVLRGDHVVGVEHAEVLRDQRVAVDRAPDVEGELDRAGSPARSPRAPSAGARRRAMAMICRFGDVEAWVNTASLKRLLVVAKSTSPHQHHRALAQRSTSTCGSSWSGRRAASALRGIGHQARVEQARVLGIEVRAEGLLLRQVALRGRAGSANASCQRAAPIAVRGRRNGEKRAKPNHASSHRKTRSGLIARHSSITRRVS